MNVLRLGLVVVILSLLPVGTSCATQEPVKVQRHRKAKRRKVMTPLTDLEGRANAFAQPGDCVRFAGKTHRKDKLAGVQMMSWCLQRDDFIDTKVVEHPPWAREIGRKGRLKIPYLAALMRVAPDRAMRLRVDGATPCAMVEDLEKLLDRKHNAKVVIQAKLTSKAPKQLVSMQGMITYKTPAELTCKGTKRAVPDNYVMKESEFRYCSFRPAERKYAKVNKDVLVEFKDDLADFKSGQKGLILGTLVADDSVGLDATGKTTDNLDDDDLRASAHDPNDQLVFGLKLTAAKFLSLGVR